MTVIIADDYTPLEGEYPTTHARILHSGVWADGGVVTASSTATGYYSDGPQSDTTYKKWGANTFPATWAEAYTEYGGSVDCCCIAAHNLGSIGAEISIDYYDGSAWVPVATSQIEDDSPIMALFNQVDSSQWRVSILSAGDTIADSDGVEVMDGDGEDIIVSDGALTAIIGVIRFGKAMQMPQRVYQGFTPSASNRNTTMTTNESATGEYLGAVVLRKSLNASVSWNLLEAQWVRSSWNPFIIAAETAPFFVAWRPDAFGEVDYMIESNFTPPVNSGPKAYMQTGFSGKAYGWE